MKKIILLILVLSFSFQNKIYSQNDNDAFAAALIGAALVANAVEEYKESLEQLATDIIISEYSGITQFRLEVIGLGGGSEVEKNKLLSLAYSGRAKVLNKLKFIDISCEDFKNLCDLGDCEMFNKNCK